MNKKDPINNFCEGLVYIGTFFAGIAFVFVWFCSIFG